MSCGQCEWKRPIAAEDIVDGKPAMCLLCGNSDLWRQKSFPVGWGVAIVALGAICVAGLARGWSRGDWSGWALPAALFALGLAAIATRIQRPQ